MIMLLISMFIVVVIFLEATILMLLRFIVTVTYEKKYVQRILKWECGRVLSIEWNVPLL